MRATFDYSVIRVVPRVEREEFMNAGVILFCRTRRFLGARLALDSRRLYAFAPWIDVEEVREHLEFVELVCAGDPAAGPIAELPLSGRFHWLSAPRSTVVQPSPVHSGLTDDPSQTLEHLVGALVLPPRPEAS
jgi:hypothetical protein